MTQQKRSADDNGGEMGIPGKITFNPQNGDTREFLEFVGYLPEEIDRGQIGPYDEIRISGDKICYGLLISGRCFGYSRTVQPSIRHVNHASLLTLANTLAPQATHAEEGGCAKDPEGNLVCHLSPKVARLGLGLMRFYGRGKIQSLFQKNVCPAEAPDILNNLLNRRLNMRMEGLVEAASCPYDPDRFQPAQVLGVYYRDEHLPAPIRSASSAVLQVMAFWRDKSNWGSAVIISRNGHVLTARHVLFDNENTFSPNVILSFKKEGHLFILPLSEENLVWQSPDLDLAVIHSEDFTKPFNDIQPLEFAAIPDWPGNVWAIGYPGQWATKEHGAAIIGERLATAGTIDFAADSASPILKLHLRAAPGNSGGAIVDEQGRLIGIVSKVELRGAFHLAVLQPDATIAILPPQVVKAFAAPDNEPKSHP